MDDDEAGGGGGGSESPAVKPLLECGILAVALEMVRVQRLLHMHPTGPEFESDARRLEGVLLRVVGAALAKSPSARHALRGAGGVEVLVEGVGAVSTDAKNAVAAGAGLAFDGGWGAPGSWDDPAAAERLHLQLAALDAIRLAVARNARNARLAADAGAFGERLAALLRRCATESAARTMREMQGGMDENATGAGAGAAGTRDATSTALREAERAPPGEHLSRAFAILRALAGSEAGEDAAGGSGSAGDLRNPRMGWWERERCRRRPGGLERGAREGVFARIVAAALDAAERRSRPGRRVGVDDDRRGDHETEARTGTTPPPRRFPRPQSPPAAGFVAAAGPRSGSERRRRRRSFATTILRRRRSLRRSTIFGDDGPSATDPPRRPRVCRVPPARAHPDDVAVAAAALLRAHVAHFASTTLSSRPRRAVDASSRRRVATSSRLGRRARRTDADDDAMAPDDRARIVGLFDSAWRPRRRRVASRGANRRGRGGARLRRRRGFRRRGKRAGGFGHVGDDAARATQPSAVTCSPDARTIAFGVAATDGGGAPSRGRGGEVGRGGARARRWGGTPPPPPPPRTRACSRTSPPPPGAP